MSHTEKYIVETYSGLFEGLSSLSKLELIENLSKSLNKSFGAFASDKSAEEIIEEIRLSRKFRKKEINF